MSKSKKRKKAGTENPNQLSTQVLEQRVRNDLAQRNYRRAKEWLKELCRRDKAHYLPQLVDCYRHLAGQMLEKGLTAEAKTVLDQIRALTGGKTDPLSEAMIATESGDYCKTAEALISHYGDGSIPLSKAMAEVLILASEDFPRLKGVNHQLYAEFVAVRKALEHVSSERFHDAAEELKHIGLHSAFADWKLFIKGLCAFYEKDDVKALDAFQRLGNDSLVSRAAKPFMFVIRGDGQLFGDEPKEPLLRQVCKVVSRPDMEPILPRAEYLWRLGRHADSYEHVAKMLSGFPTENSGLLHILTLFYFNAPFHMDARSAEKYLRGMHYAVSKKKGAFVDYLLYARMRNLYLDHVQNVPDPSHMHLWEEFLTWYERVHGENRKLQALTYAHLGDIFSREVRDDPFEWFLGPGRRKAMLNNHELAEEAYEKSLRFNKNDKDVHLGLLGLYETRGESSKRNRKLDEITRLFPDDKDVLATNGISCIERKAFAKGIDYLRRAVALDPLDQHSKEALGVGYIKASLHFATKGNADRYREFMEEALQMGQPGLNNMNRGRPYLQARLAIFEWIAGHEKEGDRLIEEAVRNGGGDPRVVYFAYLISRTYGVKEPHLSRLEKLVKTVFEDPEPATAALFAGVISYVKRISLPKPWLHGEFHRLTRYAMEAAEKTCTSQDAEEIVRLALGWESQGMVLAKKYIQSILGQDPRHPLFLYFKYLCDTDGGSKYPTDGDLRRLKDIIAIAVQRHERVLIDTLNADIRRIEEYLLAAVTDYEEEGEWDEDGGGDEEDFEKLLEEAERIVNPFRKPSGRRKKRADARQASLFDDFH